MTRPRLYAVGTATISAMSLADGVQHFLKRLQARGAAANTLAAYASDLAQYVECAARLGMGLLVAVQSQRHVARFLDDQAARGIGERSQARRLSVLRMFFRHAMREGWIGHDPTADERVRYRRKRVVAPEMSALLAMLDVIPRTGWKHLRDRALLRLAVDTGIRISEAAGVDLPGCGSQSALDLSRRLVHVVGKGGDTETVCFNDTTARWLEDWLAVRGDVAHPACHALFVTNRGTRPVRGTLHQICVARGAAAGLDGLHFHLLRHRRGAMVIERCGDKIGQQFLRHASLNSTSEYGRHADNTTFDLLRDRADVDAARAAR